MPKLIWSRLKSMLCPKCNRALTGSMLDSTYRCGAKDSGKCDFIIGKEKFDQIVNGMYTGPKSSRFEYPNSRLSELNNLGREIEDENYKQPDN